MDSARRESLPNTDELWVTQQMLDEAIHDAKRLEAECDRLLIERNQLVIAIEDHRTEMDARANGPGRDRDDIDNDLYRVLP